MKETTWIGLLAAALFVLLPLSAHGQTATVTQADVDTLKGFVGDDEINAIIQEWFNFLAGIEPPPPEPEPEPEPPPPQPGLVRAFGVPLDAPVLDYPEPRWYLQSQAWWRGPDLPVEHEGRHIHLECCFPQAQVVEGELRLDIRVRMHQQVPGTEIRWVRIAEESDTVIRRTVNIVADENGEADVWLDPFYLDTTEMKNGARELRLTANISDNHEGNRQFQSTGWQVIIDNPGGGEPDDSRRTPHWCEARGWYDLGFDYANARFLSPLPINPLTGLWEPEIQAVRGSGGDPIREHLITVDPDFHRGHIGNVVLWGEGEFRGRPTIDTRDLAAGPHRLVIVAAQEDERGRNSGVLVIPFEVE